MNIQTHPYGEKALFKVNEFSDFGLIPKIDPSISMEHDYLDKALAFPSPSFSSSIGPMKFEPLPNQISSDPNLLNNKNLNNSYLLSKNDVDASSSSHLVNREEDKILGWWIIFLSLFFIICLIVFIRKTSFKQNK